MKKFRKLIPALALLLVSAVLMSTASYAWFSMNNKVTVTGMEVKTQVSSNLLIAGDTLGSTDRLTDDKFTTELKQVVKGILEPASTADAETFFYTVDAKADGSKNLSTASSAYIQYSASSSANDPAKFTDAFSETYGITKSSATGYPEEKAVPFVDYVFQLKATNTSTDEQSIIIEQLNLKYNGDADASVTQAHRVAFFIKDITDTDPVGGPEGSSATYTVASSANFENAVINSTVSSTAAVYVADKQALTTVPAGTTKYYKVVVRMWLEGQDKTCNNDTFMPLNDKWELGVKLALVVGTDGAVKNIAQVNSSGNLINP